MSALVQKAVVQKMAGCFNELEIKIIFQKTLQCNIFKINVRYSTTLIPKIPKGSSIKHVDIFDPLPFVDNFTK